MPSAFPPDPIILMYHHVAEPPPDAPVRGLYVTPRQFAWQLDWLLQAGVRFCTFASLEAHAAETNGASTVTPIRTGPWVMLTFDDGYRDVYEQAWALLAERRIPAVVYPVVGDIGKTGIVWPESYDKTPADVVTEAQMREMSEGGIEFGSHLMDHVHADRLALPELRRQLAASSESLAKITGGPPLSIAYPYGAYTPEIAAEAGRAGFRFGVTTHTGSNRGVSPLELRRLGVKGTRLHHRWRFARDLRQELAARNTDKP